MIKNFKQYNTPHRRVKLCALSLTGLLIAGCVTGCGKSAEQPNADYATSSNVQGDVTKVFEPGSHIISIPIDDPTTKEKQYASYPGYKCVGMGTAAHGQLVGFCSGAVLLYINEYPVLCTSKDGTDYTDFGTPLEYEQEPSLVSNDGTKTFAIGEHLISMPISDPLNDNVQYQSFEGYEPIDIAVSTHGELIYFYTGGAILYANTTPVTCTPTGKDEAGNYQYASFGKPIEKEKTLVKTK